MIILDVITYRYWPFGKCNPDGFSPTSKIWQSTSESSPIYFFDIPSTKEPPKPKAKGKAKAKAAA